MNVHTTERAGPETVEQPYLAVIELDGEPILRTGVTELSAAELAAELADQVRGSCASLIEIKVTVG
jgi:hypothetical protein